MRIKLYFLSFSILISSLAIAQQKATIPFMRLIWHENIDRTQKNIDKLDGAQSQSIVIVGDEQASKQATASLFKGVDDMQNDIELDSTIDANGKIKFLRGLNEVLTAFELKVRASRGLTLAQTPQVVNAFKDAMLLEKQNKSILEVIERNENNVNELILNSFTFSKNIGVAQAREAVVRKTLENNPEKILPTLQLNPNYSFADSFIKVVAYAHPEEIYTYAQANNELSRRIKSLDDPLIKTIVGLSKMNTGRLFFPFLDNLYKGKITMEEVQANMDNKYKYFRLLVNTEIEYAGRLHQGDTPMVMSTLAGMLKKKSVDDFINVINGLHDSPDAIRMKEVEPLNAQELYYLCVMGDPEIYTSSYLKVYDRIWQRMKSPNSDTLLRSVNFDFFKKFIKMAAGYNTLDHFLKNMDKGNAEVLMRAFASGLDKTASLEDAVDVADSYASISNNNLRKLILEEIQNSYKELSQTKNKRGTVIYDILSTIFQSMDTASGVNISEKFGIPPVYSVSNSVLKDTSGRIIVQQFFYGDKDGNQVFNNFIGAYSNSNWKIVSKPQWIEVSSTRGTPITIYSNRPLDENKDLDAQAQSALAEYLISKNLNPTVVIHRGHSYYVGSTINQLVTSAKVVLLGSCGGYHNLHGVLDKCPFAHIIASKQVGSGTINQPMIVNLTERLRQGKDLLWPELWKDFGIMFSKNNLFEDYVPPHKNLGAIFIMAYSKILGNEGS